MPTEHRVCDKEIEGDGRQRPTEHLESEDVQDTSLANVQALYVEIEAMPSYVPHIP